MSGELRRVAIAASPEGVEVARARLLDLFPGGFEERELPGAVELAVYTDEAGEELLRGAFGGVSSVLVEPGWEDRWREFHRAVRAGGVWIGPPWERPPDGEPAVIVDPGRAFGTGSHPTTRACIELLAGLERGSLLDAGCGSGVVAVCAVRLGFGPVEAVDVDPVAVELARETARLNGVVVTARCADVLVDDLPSADVVVANIELGAVDRLLPRLDARVAVTSGYLAGQEPDAAAWRTVSALRLDGWAAHVLEPRGH